jgi:hypothetical protein
MMGKKKIIISILVIVLAIAVPLSVYVGASYFLTSNHKTGVVNTLSLTLTANDTNGVNNNDILMLTAQLNESKSGVSVQFYNGTIALYPSIVTDSSGKAVSYYNVTNSNAYDLYAIATIT